MNKFIIIGGINAPELGEILRSISNPNDTKVVVVTGITHLANNIELIVENMKSDDTSILTPRNIDLLKSNKLNAKIDTFFNPDKPKKDRNPRNKRKGFPGRGY